MPKLKRKVGIKLKLKTYVYNFCPNSEILETNLIFCISEPKFDDHSSHCILKSKRAILSLPEEFSLKINNAYTMENLRIYKDSLNRKKLILNLTF